MSTVPQDDESSKPLLIRRGRVESVDLYEIKDSELDQFEKGSPSDLQLNFAVFMLTLAFSAFMALTTASFSAHPSIQTAYIVVVVVGGLLGLYLLCAWWRSHTSSRDICRRIRGRIKESEVFVATVPPTVKPETTQPDPNAPKG